jgi:hypothetical protein
MKDQEADTITKVIEAQLARFAKLDLSVQYPVLDRHDALIEALNTLEKKLGAQNLTKNILNIG